MLSFGSKTKQTPISDLQRRLLPAVLPRVVKSSMELSYQNEALHRADIYIRAEMSIIFVIKTICLGIMVRRPMHLPILMWDYSSEGTYPVSSEVDGQPVSHTSAMRSPIPLPAHVSPRPRSPVTISPLVRASLSVTVALRSPVEASSAVSSPFLLGLPKEDPAPPPGTFDTPMTIGALLDPPRSPLPHSPPPVPTLLGNLPLRSPIA